MDRSFGHNLDLEHIFICVSDSWPDVEGYRDGFIEIINELDKSKFKQVITDQGVMTNNGLMFVSFTFIPK